MQTKIPLLVAALSLLLSCSDDHAGSADAAGLDGSTAADSRPARDATADRGADAGGPRKISLPADEAPHSDPVEWWYYTGTLETQDSKKYGFEFVIFQAQISSAFAYLGHFAVTDTENTKFSLDTKLSTTDQRGQKNAFKLAVGDWKLSGHAGKDTISASMKGYSLDLSLTTKTPVVYQYGKGYMTVGSTKPFYYYSYPRMAVTGSLTVNGSKSSVTGKAWMDHQWGEMGKAFDGWDWYSLRMDDNTELMLFVVRKSGSEAFVGGTFVESSGTYHELEKSDFTITSKTTWKSTHSKGVYPQGWRIQVPSRKLDVSIDPVMKDQEFYESVLGTPIYWEGLCTIKGTRDGKSASGDAYVELTGYD